MGTLITTAGNSGADGKGSGPAWKQATANLADGTRVVCVPDYNQVGVTGDGGDGTGVPKLKIYTSPTETDTWTLRVTMTISGSSYASGKIVGSMAVGGNDNLHICYISSSGTLIYNLLTRSGATWTVGANETVAAALPAGEFMSRVDMDVCGVNNNAFIALAKFKSTGATYSKVARYLRKLSNTWQSMGDQNFITGTTTNAIPSGYTNTVAVAADSTVIAADNLSTVCYIMPRKATTGVDYGDLAYIMTVNVSTGAVVANIPLFGTGNINKGKGNGYREYRLFSVGMDTWILGGTVEIQPWTTCAMKFYFDRTTNSITTLAPLTTWASGGAARNDTINWTDCFYYNKTLTFLDTGGLNAYSRVVKFDDAAKKVSGGVDHYWSNSYLYGGSLGFRQVWAGTQRNYVDTPPVMMYYSSNTSVKGYRFESESKVRPMTAVKPTPATNSTVTTDRPILGMQHKLSRALPQYRVKGEWQIASDAGFTTNVRTITEPDTAFIEAANTNSPKNAVVVSLEPTSALAELYQGIWYIRARSIDESTSTGAWSASASFTVLHQPSPANLYPTADRIFIYGATGRATFTWKFTDPSPYDYQTAYEITVENANDGSLVVNTGKQISSGTSATIDIPSSGKDVSLRWRMRLWDSDDVQGDWSGYQRFYITDPPTPAITSPLSNDTITTAVPVFTWDPGVFGDKLQSNWRLVITQANRVTYDTSWRPGQDTSFQIPTATLRNAQSYTATLYVRDNLLLEGTTSITINTAWVAPAVPPTKTIYTHFFSTKGYIWIAQDPTGYDPDFVAYNLYKRKYGETTWTLLTSWTDASRLLSYRDFLVASGESYEYTVTQLVNRFGDLLESSQSADDVMTVRAISDSYWLIDPLSEYRSFPLFSVTDDPFTDEYEEETYNVIGRGRHVDYGDRLGYSGTLTSQLRDRQFGGVAHTNYTMNPQLIREDPNAPSQPYGAFNVSGGTVGTKTDYFEATFEPPPTGQEYVYKSRATGLGLLTTDLLYMTYNWAVADHPDILVGGNTVVISGWFYDDEAQRNKADFLVRGEFRQGVSAAGQFTTLNNPTAIETDVTGKWKRYQISGVLPANGTFDTLRMYMGWRGSATKLGGDVTVALTGVQLELGTNATPYVDGDQFGGQWKGEPHNSISTTTGYYTARQQRLDIEAIKGRRRPLYIRNPFGDILKIAAGNIGVTRIPGVGATELTDLTIPYTEVDF